MVCQESFNTQPPEGGWFGLSSVSDCLSVSTHSRLKAAGNIRGFVPAVTFVSTHSRLKAAGIGRWTIGYLSLVSTHSRLKAAGNRQ